MPPVHIVPLYRAFPFSSGLSPALNPPGAATSLQKVHIPQVSTQGFCDVALATCATTAHSHLSLDRWNQLQLPRSTMNTSYLACVILHNTGQASPPPGSPPSALSICMYTSVVAPVTLYHKCLLTSLSLSLTLTSLSLGIISFHTQTPTSTPCLTHRREMKE